MRNDNPPLDNNQIFLIDATAWISVYDSNCSIVLDSLKSQGATSTTISAAQKCFRLLKEYLLTKDLAYSPSLSWEWYRATENLPTGSSLMLHRIEDVYETGAIRVQYMLRRYDSYKYMNPYWEEIVDQFLPSLPSMEREKKVYKRDCALFAKFLQENDVSDPAGISLIHVQGFMNQENGRLNARNYRNRLGRICEFLKYLHDKKGCPSICSRYLEGIFCSSIVKIEDFSLDQLAALEVIRAESLDFPVSEMGDLINPFIDRLVELGYSTTVIRSFTFCLKSLRLFLEINGFGFHIRVASTWLEVFKNRYSSEAWKGLRRCIELFNQYTVEGDILPETIFTSEPILMDFLPDWCTEEIVPYLELRKKEGCAQSTLNMNRSCIVRFCQFLCERGLSSFSEITPEFLSDFNISDPHRTAEAKNAYNSRIRRFLKHLERRQIIPYNTHKALMCAAAYSEKLVVVLTDEELEQLAIKNEAATSPLELRDSAIMAIGLHMGLRGSDIVGLDLGSVDWKRQTIRFSQKKNGTEIELPMPTEVGNALYKYIKYARPKTQEKALFLSVKAPYRRIGKSAACYKALIRLLPERDSPGSGFHVTRKTFSTEKIRQKITPSAIRDLLGSSDETSLRPYLSLDEKNMRLCPISLEEAGLQLREDYYHEAT